MKRIPTGIRELDRLIGGYPSERPVIVTGGPGVGKTILCLQFLAACCQRGERSILVSTSDESHAVLLQADEFGWNLQESLENGLLKVTCLLPARALEAELALPSTNSETSQFNAFFSDILQELESRPKNLVIDNLGALTDGLPFFFLRTQIDRLVYALQRAKITVLIVMDEASMEHCAQAPMYSVDGVIRLSKEESGHSTDPERRHLQILKMKHTIVAMQSVPFDFSPTGIHLHVDPPCVINPAIEPPL